MGRARKSGPIVYCYCRLTDQLPNRFVKVENTKG
jgi:hypothetical protein